MKPGVAMVSVVFALALCWGVGKFLNLNVVAFHPAGIPISWTMVVFVGGLGTCVWLLGRR